MPEALLSASVWEGKTDAFQACSESSTAQLEHVDAPALNDFTFPESRWLFSNLRTVSTRRLHPRNHADHPAVWTPVIFGM